MPNGPASVGGQNNAGADPSGVGNSAKSTNQPVTNTAGTANSPGLGSSGSSASTSGAVGTVGTAGNRAGGATGGRIDGTVTEGPAMSGDTEIRAEDAKVDKKVKSICKGC